MSGRVGAKALLTTLGDPRVHEHELGSVADACD